MSNAAVLTGATFTDAVADGVTLVDFWAEWCGPCRMIAPVVDEIAAEYAGKAKVGKVNVDEEPDLATQFNVQSIPTLLVIKNGAEVKRFIGYTKKNELAEALDAALA
ncbi:MAG TPA: thioredoxin [Candidatus Hydrogenedentes bacterium]|nr:thioredoxin [Candidatus Hydrogenedentota bacterium]